MRFSTAAWNHEAPHPAMAACFAGQSAAADAIPRNGFDRLHALIKPTAEEQTWALVPWQVSLWEARKKAAEEGKPILLWEMDGNPLGCT